LLAGGRTREAEAPLERALELQPNSVRVLLQRAIAAQESGQPVRAVDLLRRAKTIAPDNSAVWLNLGYSAELSNANDEAVAAYQRYLQLTNGRSGADSQRAYVGERLRNLGKP
jgi:predicted Zn-dependent protease